MVYRALREIILTTTAITNIIGDRFYDNRVRQKSGYPAGYQRRLDHPRAHSFDGQLDLQDEIIDTFWYAETQTELEDLMEAVENNLDQVSGTYKSVNVDNTRVLSSGQNDRPDELEVHIGHIEIEVTIRR